VKEIQEKIAKFKETSAILNEDDAETEQSDVSLSTRIAKEAYRITLSVSEDNALMVTLAMGILNQAQALVGNDTALALRLYNRARIIARKR
jgi:hypothetical protein